MENSKKQIGLQHIHNLLKAKKLSGLNIFNINSHTPLEVDLVIQEDYVTINYKNKKYPPEVVKLEDYVYLINSFLIQ